MQEVILQKVKEAQLILTGIGENFISGKSDEDIKKAYKGLLKLLEGKNYFIITTCVDELLYETGFKEERIVRPLAEEEADMDNVPTEKTSTVHPSRWDTYMKWLQGTLNKKLLVLELGVGLKYPDIIRFPFEKMVYFNLKADFIRVHDKLFQLPAELNGRGISISEDPVCLLASDEM